MFAIIDAYRAGLLQTKNWPANVTAGLIVGIVALPLAMAFAIASGVKPEQGLYTAIIAALFVGLFGGSRVQIAGPTGAFIVILASITARYGVNGLQIATLLAGFILIFMGLVKLGSVIKYIPDPVIVGFTTGIGVIIFVGEWKDFFGLNLSLGLNAPFYQKLFSSIHALGQINFNTTSLAIISLLLVIYSPKFSRRLPGPLVAMVVATILQTIFQFDNVATIGSMFGGIPQQLPQFHVPEVTVTQALELIGPAFTIALLGAIESLLSATAADGMAGTRHHSNKELIGQGLANIFAPLFGGFAATGAIARTATNIRNGGNSPISALIHSLFLIFVLLYLAPFAAYIPMCALAAILFVVAYNMSDLHHFIHMMKCAPRQDLVVLLATFLLTLFTDLVIAVNVGVILAMLFFIRRMIQTVGIEEQSQEQVQQELFAHGVAEIPTDTIVYTIQGPFFFGAAEKIERALQASNSDPKTIIFRMKDVPFIDMTGLETFSELVEQYHQRGIKIYICEANMRVRRKLANVGILNWTDSDRIFNSFADVFKTQKDNLVVAEEIKLH